MNCAEVREYLFAFLDSELDASHSMELQRHLDRCPECAREAEIERTVRKQLAAAIARDAADVPPFTNTHDGMLQNEVEPGHTSATVRWGRLASAAVVLVAVGGALWFAVGRGSPDHASPGHGDLSFVDALVKDFRHFLNEGQPLQVRSDDRSRVSRWLADQTQLAVYLPSLPDERARLVGGRKCKIAGRPAAFAVYDLEGAPASLVVLAADENELAGMQRVRHADGIHWVDRCRGHTVVACRRGKLIYAAVSKLSEEKLLTLVEDTQHEGD